MLNSFLVFYVDLRPSTSQPVELGLPGKQGWRAKGREELRRGKAGRRRRDGGAAEGAERGMDKTRPT
eukprot:10066538-Alexandrium_andersonii.AAC.1